MAPMHNSSDVLAEMVANVIKVYVAVGESIEAGQAVVLLESMKMEIPVLVERAGLIAEVRVAEGDVVQEGDVLVSLAAVAS